MQLAKWATENPPPISRVLAVAVRNAAIDLSGLFFLPSHCVSSVFKWSGVV